MTQREAIQAEIVRSVRRVEPQAQVILFGSQARNDHRPESDWDVLVLTDKSVDPSLKRALIRELLDVQLSYSISIGSVVRNRQDWEDGALTWFYQEIKKDGKLLA